MPQFDVLDQDSLVLAKPDPNKPQPTNEEYAKAMRKRGWGEFVEMLGFGGDPEFCGSHKSGYHCDRPYLHTGKHSWVHNETGERRSR